MAVIPNLLSVYLNFLGPASAQATCCLYFVPVNGTPDPTKMNLLADVFMAKYKGALRDVLPTTCQIVNVRVLWNGIDTQFEGASTDGAAFGLVESDFMGEEISVVLQRRTNFRGRNMRGRIFLPFVPKDYALQSTLTTEAINNYGALCSLLMTDTTYDAKTYEPRHVDRKTETTPQITGWRLVGEIMSRRDRRFPKRPVVYT
jgi:hypothetical protein